MATTISAQTRKLSAILPLVTSAVVLVYLVFFVAYAQGTGEYRLTIWNFLSFFWETEQWQHCWLVVPALVFIVYQKRRVLLDIPRKGENFGGIILIAAFAFYWLGFRVDNYFFGYFSIQLLVAGLIVWFAGWRWMLALAFPFAFMSFMWPLHFLESSITFPLRAVMSRASVEVLNFIGIPVILQGTGILSAPDALTSLRPGQRFSVDVADPCSGIRSLFALMMVSALYGHFTLKEWWQKWLIFLCSIPLAILGNLCRILMLTFGTMAMGPAVAIGTLEHPSFFHMAAGYTVFAVALGGMIGAGWFLQMIPTWIGNRTFKPMTENQSLRSVKSEFKGRNEEDPY